MANHVSRMIFGVLFLVASYPAMFSHFTPSQLIKEYMRRTKSAATLTRSLYDTSTGVAEMIQSCAPYVDVKACERRAKVLSAMHMRKHDRETLHNKARVMLGVNEHLDGHMNATVALVSLLRMSPSIPETLLPKNNYELKLKDVASTLRLKNKNAIAAMQSWFCTTTLFC